MLSRFLRTVALKTLTGREMKIAMKNIFQDSEPENLRTDARSEYVNSTVKEYLNSKDIKHIKV